jgi:prolyl oligopeptidase
LGFVPYVSEDGAYLWLYVYHGTSTKNRVYYRPLDGSTDFVRLLDDADASYHPVGNIGSKVYFHTDLEAPRGRIISIDLENPKREHWQEILPQGEDVIDQATLANGRFVISCMHHARHRLLVFDIQGQQQQEIDLPGIGSVQGIEGKEKEDDIYFLFTSFLYPATVFHCKLDSGKTSRLGKEKLSFTPTDFETRQVFYTSREGTRVPMFITHKKGLKLDGSNPAMLYGYGGFNISMTPTFSPSAIGLLEQGAVYAVACLRGGGEYGDQWHQAGMLWNKQNVFDDFIAAGQWLVQEGYTGNNKLAIMGGSNGGLLVAACMVQQPEMFGAVICRVPVIDMLRYHKFTVGRYWIPEYGNAEADPGHFRFLMAYSPLHNVREDVTYPPVLIMTADTDDRVVPGHALKFAATLVDANKKNPMWLRVETKAGHGLGKPTTKLIDEAADIQTFLELVWEK